MLHGVGADGLDFEYRGTDACRHITPCVAGDSQGTHGFGDDGESLTQMFFRLRVSDDVADRAERPAGQAGTDNRLLNSVHAQVYGTELCQNSGQGGLSGRG